MQTLQAHTQREKKNAQLPPTILFSLSFFFLRASHEKSLGQRADIINVLRIFTTYFLEDMLVKNEWAWFHALD